MADRPPDLPEPARGETTDVQIGAKHVTLRPRELTGPERNIAWTDVILREDPRIGRFATKARRTIPVAVLQPVRD